MTGLAKNIRTKSADDKKFTGACNIGRRVGGFASH